MFSCPCSWSACWNSSSGASSQLFQNVPNDRPGSDLTTEHQSCIRPSETTVFCRGRLPDLASKMQNV